MSAIHEFILNEPLFDTHEHLAGIRDTAARGDKLTYREFTGFADSDLRTAHGLENLDLAGADDRKFFELWDKIAATGYGAAAGLATRKLFKLDFTLENAGAITNALRKYARDKTFYLKLFKAANIRWIVSDACWTNPSTHQKPREMDYPDFARHVVRHDDLLDVNQKQTIENLEKAQGCSIHTLRDLNEFLDRYAERAVASGRCAGFKSAVAYMRPLRFDAVSFQEAEKAFDSLMRGRTGDLAPLHDYLFHGFVQRAAGFNLPVQLHCGYLAGNFRPVPYGDPSPLISLLQQYRNVRFVLFHAGWPYSEVLGAIGKNFPNVWLDLCWAWCLSPSVTARILSDWLSYVPSNKIFAFGGDMGSPFCSLMYALQAREGLCRVFERKIADGDLATGMARNICRRIMHENAEGFYA